MEEYNNENREEYAHNQGHHHHDHHHSDCWLKYLAIALAAFLGAFLAVYIVLDRTLYRYAMPHYNMMGFHKGHHFNFDKKFKKSYDIDKYIKEQEKLFDDITRFENNISPFAINPVKIQTFKENDAYKIVIDLRQFDGDPDKIQTDIQPKKVKLSGHSDMSSKDGSRDISFVQNFTLPKKIDVDGVKREVKDGNYIITLPLED